MDKAEQVIAELLLEDDPGLEERFLQFLLFEPAVKILRDRGMSNNEILELCQRADQRQRDEQTDERKAGESSGPDQ